ncbi:MAG: hypothetical protein HGA45_26260 [Chloroflexales bacterium]|nr:hypothetical protein [Chloroflexales bacterium]
MARHITNGYIAHLRPTLIDHSRTLLLLAQYGNLLRNEVTRYIGQWVGKTRLKLSDLLGQRVIGESMWRFSMEKVQCILLLYRLTAFCFIQPSCKLCIPTAESP